MRATRPLFYCDPGWLFVLTGLVICAAGVLLPAQADLHALETQLSQLHAEEARAYQRLAAHADFLDQVERGEPSIIRRLAAAQLNLVPQGDRPILLASRTSAPVTDWIDATVDPDIRPVRREPASTLSRWAGGPLRLWMFGGGIMAVFMGLLLSSGAHRNPPETFASECAGDDDRAFAVRADAVAQSVDCETFEERGEREAEYWRHKYADVPPLRAVASSGAATADAEAIEASLVAETLDLFEEELQASSRTVIHEDGFENEVADDDAAAGPEVEIKLTALPANSAIVAPPLCEGKVDRDDAQPAVDDASDDNIFVGPSDVNECDDADATGFEERAALMEDDEVEVAPECEASIADRPDGPEVIVRESDEKLDCLVAAEVVAGDLKRSKSRRERSRSSRRKRQ